VNRIIARVAVGAFLAAAISAAHAQSSPPRFSMTLEGAAAWQGKNDVRIPNDASGTRFALDDVTGTGPFPVGRLEATYRFGERHHVRGLINIVSFSETGRLAETTRFKATTFAAGAATEGLYKFNNYRLTYAYGVIAQPTFGLQLGLTAFVRDAAIELRQSGRSAERADLGVVPLIYVRADWRFAERWQAIAEVDGLVSGQGRAIDFAVKLGYDLTPNWTIAGGYRLLDGGVDNDKVYNFASLHQAVLSLTARF
jgi:hypothetical protein